MDGSPFDYGVLTSDDVDQFAKRLRDPFYDTPLSHSLMLALLQYDAMRCFEYAINMDPQNARVTGLRDGRTLIDELILHVSIQFHRLDSGDAKTVWTVERAIYFIDLLLARGAIKSKQAFVLLGLHGDNRDIRKIGVHLIERGYEPQSNCFGVILRWYRALYMDRLDAIRMMTSVRFRLLAVLCRRTAIPKDVA